MTPRALQYVDELLAAVESLRLLHADATVIPFGRCRARDKVFAAAEKLRAAKAIPLVSTLVPYGWRNAGRPITANAVGTTEGREP